MFLSHGQQISIPEDIRYLNGVSLVLKTTSIGMLRGGKNSKFI
jgi:hypothetical protein